MKHSRFVAGRHITGGDGEAEVIGEVLVPRVEDRLLADDPLEDGAF